LISIVYASLSICQVVYNVPTLCWISYFFSLLSWCYGHIASVWRYRWIFV